MNEFVYNCIDCQWQGTCEQLEYEKQETCFGTDNIEICPQCGSCNVLKKVPDVTFIKVQSTDNLNGK